MQSQRFLLRCSKSCAMLISPERSDGNLLEQFDRAIPRLFGYVYPCNEQRSELIRFQWGSGLAGDRQGNTLLRECVIASLRTGSKREPMDDGIPHSLARELCLPSLSCAPTAGIWNL
jgi:hypothetical protein